MEKFYSFIVMFTISDDTLRDAFREALKEKLGAEELNESTYSIKADRVGSAQQEVTLICNAQKGFQTTDFVTLYYSATMAGYTKKNGNEKWDKIIKYDVKIL